MPLVTASENVKAAWLVVNSGQVSASATTCSWVRNAWGLGLDVPLRFRFIIL